MNLDSIRYVNNRVQIMDLFMKRKFFLFNLILIVALNIWMGDVKEAGKDSRRLNILYFITYIYISGATQGWYNSAVPVVHVLISFLES